MKKIIIIAAAVLLIAGVIAAILLCDFDKDDEPTGKTSITTADESVTDGQLTESTQDGVQTTPYGEFPIITEKNPETTEITGATAAPDEPDSATVTTTKSNAIELPLVPFG